MTIVQEWMIFIAVIIFMIPFIILYEKYKKDSERRKDEIDRLKAKVYKWIDLLPPQAYTSSLIGFDHNKKNAYARVELVVRSEEEIAILRNAKRTGKWPEHMDANIMLSQSTIFKKLEEQELENAEENFKKNKIDTREYSDLILDGKDGEKYRKMIIDFYEKEKHNETKKE